MSLWHPCQFDPTQKPEPGTAEVDWDHPSVPAQFLAMGEAAGGATVDLATGASCPLVSTAWVPAGLTFGGGATASYVSTGLKPFVPRTSDFTIFARVRIIQSSVTHWIFARDRSGVAAYQARLSVSSGQKLSIQIGDAASTVSISFSGPTPLAVGRWYSVAFVRRGVVGELYLDGRSEGTGSGASVIDLADTTKDVRWGAREADAGNYLRGSLECGGFAMSRLDAAWLAAEPYAMLRPVAPHRTYSVGAGFNAAYYRRFVASRGAA